MKNIKGRIVKISDLTHEAREDMYQIMIAHYQGMTAEIFRKDLEEKNHVILLENKSELVGFSTLLWKKIEIEGQKVIGVFSGDTILKPEYWGTSALGVRFLQYLWTLKLQNPFTPVYWFLISKGYKTYLLMANNFRDSFPRPEREMPFFERKLRDHFYGEKFGDQYNSNTGVIRFKDSVTCKLRGFVAPITQDMRERYPRLSFFEKVNPLWSEGQELACITRLTLDFYTVVVMPILYLTKKLFGSKKAFKASTVVQLPIGYQNNSRLSVARVSQWRSLE